MLNDFLTKMLLSVDVNKITESDGGEQFNKISEKIWGLGNGVYGVLMTIFGVAAIISLLLIIIDIIWHAKNPQKRSENKDSILTILFCVFAGSLVVTIVSLVIGLAQDF